MVKTYQLANEGQYGTSLKLAPVTTSKELNKETRLQVNGTAENAIEIQSILPNAKSFSLIGTKTLLGMVCDKFRLEEVIGIKKNVYTQWVRYKKSPKYPSSRMPIPVRYEMRGYNTLLGSNYDHYYLDYDNYSHDDVPNEVFEINPDMVCIGFHGPGVDHYATFNPMKEFIHPTKDHHLEMEFTRFKGKHGARYMNQTEHEYRKNVFRSTNRGCSADDE